MKILHLADVHFHHSTLADLAAPCSRIVEIARDHSAELDCIVIAGDLTTERGFIDNATAVAARSFVQKLAKFATVYVEAGNHDLTFKDDQPNNLRAILADDLGSVLSNVHVIDSPTFVHRDGYSLSFIPYPNPATFHALTGESDLSVMSSRLTDVVRGLAAQAVEHGGASLAVYHGTVEGGRMGDESSPSLKTRGRDIMLPVAALADFQATLCGHLHHPQTIQTPGGIAVYPGCVAPLTYGERTIEPGVLLWTIGEGGVQSSERIPLPVAHQRLQVEITPEQWDEASDARINLRQWINPVAKPDARVKVKVTMAKQRLELITPDLIASVKAECGLDDLKVDKTEIPSSRFLLGEDTDRAARVDIVEALGTYADYSADPAYREHLEGIQSIGREVEELVSRDDEDPRYDFHPVRIDLTNYKQFADVSLDLGGLSDRSGILGPTGIGKSNLILAMAAALYGGNPKSEVGQARTSLGEMVRRGESDASVRLEFVSHGRTYRVTRDIHVDGKGRGTSVLHLALRDGEAWLSQDGGDSRSTQAAIELLVGPQSMHWTTRHLRQHGRSAVKMGSADLADSINGTLQLNFQTRQDHAKQIVATAVAAKQAAETRAETLRSQIPDEAAIDEQERQARARKEAAEVEGVSAQKRADDMEDRLAEAQEQHATAKAKLDAVASVHLRRIDTERKLTESRQEVAKLESELHAYGAAPDLDALEAVATEARGVATAAADRVEELKDEDHRLSLEEAQTLGGLRESMQAAALRRSEASSRHEGAKRRVDELGRTAAKLAEVPCRGERWLDPAEGEMDGSVCPLLVDAKLAKDGLSDATFVLNTAAEKYTGADEDYRVAAEHFNGYKASTEAEAERRRGEVRAAQERMNEARRLSHEAGERLRQHMETAQRIRSINERLAPLQERVALLTAQVQELNDDSASVESLRGSVETLASQVQQIRTDLQAAREAAQRCREVIVRCETELATCAKDRQRRADTIQTIEAMVGEAGVQERRRLCASYYLEAVQRNGIPSLLLEQLAPQLERRVNDLLAPAGRRIRIETTRETTTGKTRTEVNLHFQSPTSRGAWVPIAELSGGEEDLANAAWAVGLARVSSDMTATPLGLLVLDEPFTGVSAEYEEAIREVLGSIQDHVRRVLVITHRRDLMPLFDSAVVLSQNGAGTAVEVIA